MKYIREVSAFYITLFQLIRPKRRSLSNGRQ